jgi:pyrroline-5-carboxylate reductase
MNLSLIGCGKLGYSILKVLLNSGTFAKEKLSVFQRSKERRALVEKEEEITVYSSDYTYLKDKEVILIAVKPQDFKELASSIWSYITNKQLIVSVMTGIKIATLRGSLPGAGGYVRLMPNLPLRIGCGMTPYFYDEELSTCHLQQLKSLLVPLGESLRLHNESLINVATAVSGSGPAFVSAFIRAFLTATVSGGFSEQEANKIVYHTLRGSVELWRSEAFGTSYSSTISDLIFQIKSKGGTTEAGFKVLEEGNFEKVLEKAILAAIQRAQELGEKGAFKGE